MSRQAIEITGLRKTYAGQKGEPPKDALKGIDLSIPAGSIFGLLGPNGAGKSTLINILAGLVNKTAGQVSIWGFDQDVNPRQSRAAIGVMPQELNIDPFFTPRGALEVQAGLYGVPKSERRTDDILELIGLSDKAEAYARTLSGGMRRRLLLGKALVHSPAVLVLDEPTAGVDIELRQMLWDNVRALNKQGMTIILTTHYLEEAEEMCDEIAIINHGEVVVRDRTATLLGQLDAKNTGADARARDRADLARRRDPRAQGRWAGVADLSAQPDQRRADLGGGCGCGRRRCRCHLRGTRPSGCVPVADPFCRVSAQRGAQVHPTAGPRIIARIARIGRGLRAALFARPPQVPAPFIQVARAAGDLHHRCFQRQHVGPFPRHVAKGGFEIGVQRFLVAIIMDQRQRHRIGPQTLGAGLANNIGSIHVPARQPRVKTQAGRAAQHEQQFVEGLHRYRGQRASARQ